MTGGVGCGVATIDAMGGNMIGGDGTRCSCEVRSGATVVLVVAVDEVVVEVVVVVGVVVGVVVVVDDDDDTPAAVFALTVVCALAVDVDDLACDTLR